MAESNTLTGKQLAAASLLATGMSQVETGKQLNVTRHTILRWSKEEEFRAEVERRKQQLNDAHQEQADRLIETEVSQFYDAIREYRDARIQIYKAKIAIGTSILKKARSRLTDLPEEAIAPNVLPQLIKAADDLTENGLSGWAELIGLDAVMEKLNEDTAAGG